MTSMHEVHRSKSIEYCVISLHNELIKSLCCLKCLISCHLKTPSYFFPAFAQRCPSGWTLYQDSCFIIYTTWKNWYDSRLACQAEQGDLPIVTSVEMNTFLTSFTEQAGNTAWLGLNDFEAEGTFQWNDGTPLTAPLDTLWKDNNPNDPDGSEDCGGLRADGTWVDLSCIVNKYRVCQRPNGKFCKLFLLLRLTIKKYLREFMDSDWLKNGLVGGVFNM